MALLARAKREVLLRAHRHRLRREDLEDCYSQATLELLAGARAGARYADRAHIANTLELRFVSRVHDFARAVGGRSAMRAALEGAASLGTSELAEHALADGRADVEKLVMFREELRRVASLARGLSGDQRLVLAWQLGQFDAEELCSLVGWSPAKYRKVAQRARARLSALVHETDPARPGTRHVTPPPARRSGGQGRTYDCPPSPHS